MSVVGHEQIRHRLTGRLPRATLFLGPASVGKWTLAEHLRAEHKILAGDVLRLRQLTADAARTAVSFCHSAPMGQRRLAIIRIDGADPRQLHMLLKTLEESPASTHIILLAQEMPLETISSRTEIYRFALLSDEQVEDVLLQRKFKPGDAKRWAALAGGQVRNALDLSEGLDAKVTVLAAIRAIRERDANALDNLAGKWGDQHSQLLGALCHEAVTGRWRIFDPAEVEGMGRRLPLSILFALRADIRPRLVVRSSLMTILKGAA